MKSPEYGVQHYDMVHHINHSYGHGEALNNYPPLSQAPVSQQHILPDGRLVLVGLTAIGKAVGAGPGTIKKWIREENFPVRRCSDGIYRASPESVRAWFARPIRGNA